MYNNIQIKKLGQSEIVITAQIEWSELEKYKKDALKRIGGSVTLDGFRKGNIPEKILIQHVGEKTVMEKAAEIALSNAYPKILAEQKIFPITRPAVEFTKLALGNPFEFKITVAVMPEVILTNYKKIAATENQKPAEKIEVSDKEVDEVILEIRKAQVDHSKHDHTISKEAHDAQLEKEAPELNDELLKKLGDFKNVDDLKAKVRQNLIEEKEHKSREKKRIAIVDAIITQATIDVPKVLIESELNKMTEQFKLDLTRMGANLPDYLKHLKKTEEELRKDWTADAIKRVKLQLTLNKISANEKIEPTKEEIKKEVEHIIAHYKDADQERAKDYADTILTNEKVIQFLEEQK